MEEILGAEDFVFDNEGNIYTGSVDGVIYKVNGKTFKAKKFARTLGRPLGLKFDKNGNLIVADADFGLLSVDKGGRVSQLCSEADGFPVRLANFLDIAEDGSVYFTDSSKEPLHRVLKAVGDGMKSGRVLKYDPESRKCDLVASNFQFPNGLVLTDGGNSLLVSETGMYRVVKIQLQGSNKGKQKVWLETPGMPDNLYKGSNGIVYIPIPAARNSALEYVRNKLYFLIFITNANFNLVALQHQAFKGSSNQVFGNDRHTTRKEIRSRACSGRKNRKGGQIMGRSKWSQVWLHECLC